MYIDIKILNQKKLQLKILIDSGCTHIDTDEQLVKEERIKTVLLFRPFNTFNVNRTRSSNHRVTQFAPLELEINKHIENINITVTCYGALRH